MYLPGRNGASLITYAPTFICGRMCAGVLHPGRGPGWRRVLSRRGPGVAIASGYNPPLVAGQDTSRGRG